MNKPNVYLKLLRPHQYIKNGFVWLPLFFAYKIYDLAAIRKTFYAFLAFCLTSSCVYIINDLRDIHEDRRHPVKKLRPIASGEISQKEAVVLLLIGLSLAVCIGYFLLSGALIAVLGAYLTINLLYSGFLKRIPIIDVVCIAIGFVFRIFAGGSAADVPISHWIVIMTFLIALFLALAKRRDDLLLLAKGHKDIRKNLDGYNSDFVSYSMVLSGAVIIVSYILYTVSPEIVHKHGTDQLYLTSFWVIIGILRYLQITFVEERSGSPTLLIIRDVFLQAVVILWILSFYLILYKKIL